MLTRSRVSYAALVMSVVGCGGKSSAERSADHDRVRVSWEQTVRLVGAEWIGRAVPDAYASRTLARATEELQSETESLQKEDLPMRERSVLVDSLRAARALSDSLESAVSAGDRASAARLIANSPRVNADSLLRRAGLR